MSNQFPLDVDVETVGPLLTRKATPSKSSSFDVLDLEESDFWMILMKAFNKVHWSLLTLENLRSWTWSLVMSWCHQATA